MATKTKSNSRIVQGKTKSALASGGKSKRLTAQSVRSLLTRQTRGILESVSDGFVAFDAQMNYTYVNPRGEEMLGRKSEDLVGKNYWAEYPEAKGTPFSEAYMRALETQMPIMFEDHFAPWDRWFENRIYPSKAGLTVFFTEITERKRAEKALRQSNEQLRELTNHLTEAEEHERRKLARELHDGVGQSLTALSINLAIIRNQLSAASAQNIGSRIDDSIHLVEETVESVRDVMADLFPPVITDYGLAAALRWYGQQFTRHTEIPVNVETVGETETRLPSYLEAIFFRITQEALTNVANHAGAKHVLLQLETIENATRLTIEDDGCGFDPSTIDSDQKKGWGLWTMRERIKAAGGRLHLDSTPGIGTKIIAEITPLWS
jgi:PAS domain S-box-containing protein